jgi:hypothetical protein
VPVQHAGIDPILWSVDGSAPDDVWAVGAYYDPLANAQVQHWDGKSWTLVPDGAADLPVTALRGVHAIAKDDVWAVGLYNASADGTGPIQPLIQHWDGRAWTVVPAPEAGANAILLDVAAAAADDVWAVGHFSPSSTDMQALIQRWDGKSWNTVDGADVGADHALDAITVVAADDVWAVGRMHKDGQWSPLVEHWDGEAWTVVPSGAQGGILNGIAAAAPDDIWAVGTSTEPNTVLTLHWDGSSWSGFTNGLAAITLDDVTMLGPDEGWAVGAGPDLTVVTARWDGQSWSAAPTPKGLNLNSVASFAADDVWSVGHNLSEALAIHYTNACGSTGRASRPPTGR